MAIKDGRKSRVESACGNEGMIFVMVIKTSQYALYIEPEVELNNNISEEKEIFYKTHNYLYSKQTVCKSV